MKNFEGKLDAKGMKFGIVVSRYNELLTNKLLEGAIDCLERHNCGGDSISTAWVPGAFEIPVTAKIMAESGNFDAVICLGAVLKGDTSHNTYIANEVVKGISQISLGNNFPVIFGVITPDTLEQAIERAGTRLGNAGWAAALNAIEMVSLFKSLKTT